MKRFLLFILILVVIFLTFVYIFIPGEMSISAMSIGSCIPKNVVGCLNKNKINQWWPGKMTDKKDSSFIYKNDHYKFSELYSNGADVVLNKGQKNFETNILVNPTGKDSSAISWQTSSQGSVNPFKRISQYFEANEIKNNMLDILDSLSSFASKPENIYGFAIERTTFNDTILFATRFSSKTYPSIETIYEHINEMKKLIKDAGATEKDFPMLNVNQTDSNNYETMIAICVDKEIQGDKNFFVSRMVPMKDRFLKTTAIGGSGTIQNAHNAINDYMNDHFLTAPAIPFEILMTDRNKETDTSKWKTVIFHPSM